QNDVTLKMPAFEWVHVQLHQQKGMISLSPPTICNSALEPWSIMPCSSALRSLSSCCSDVRSAAVCVCFSPEPEVMCSLLEGVIFTASWACEGSVWISKIIVR
ncbi:hypothetical protein M1983_21845, partial [Klebsiella pneumoniae]|nr:hypothetical protein [Klebsiella pneumoniae]MDZ2625666.1 hypothetical protein [Klebsiella pneumoniae]MDZ2696969.1 hypothetical protein [Klebsiella pneumoniae]MDZ2747496.1 hypothetical protein [Klebsiella pneumoniae]